jgi:uncharacterized protein (TIGR02145 family)
MKKITLLSLITLVFIGNLVSQAPNLMSYQAVIWDGSGNLVTEKTVSIKISILQGSVTGTSVYSETHRVQTNVNGLVSLMIGGGTNLSGKISDINWGGGSFFLKTETDPIGGNSYSIIGTTQLVSVPYSLFSGLSKNIQTPKVGLPGQVLVVDENGNPTWSGAFVPNVKTKQITDITTTSVNTGGEITTDCGANVTERGIVWSVNPKPTVNLSTKIIEGSGVGSFNTKITGLTPNTKYYLRAFASNCFGVIYGNEIEFNSQATMGIPCPDAPTIKDIDGNIYNTVLIGTQCWMKENLRVSKYRNGEVIPVSSDNVQWSNLNKGSRCWYENDSVLFNLPYGNLYNLYAVIDDKKLCPNGWHIPTDTEWNILTLFLGGENIAGGKMKSVGTTYWNSPNTGATNESGFTGFPGGFRDSNGSFKNGKLTSFFWSSTIYDLDYARNRGLDHNGANIFKYTIGYKTVGASVRCLKD